MNNEQIHLEAKRLGSLWIRNRCQSVEELNRHLGPLHGRLTAEVAIYIAFYASCGNVPDFLDAVYGHFD